MMWEPGYATQTGCGEFRVRSQTDPDKSHMVRETASGLVCECSDHAYRKADYKHIKVVLEIAMKNKGYRNSGFRTSGVSVTMQGVVAFIHRTQPLASIMELSKLNLCNNYAKKHGGIGGMTPAEAALIKADGRNKWMTLIQNAALHKIHG